MLLLRFFAPLEQFQNTDAKIWKHWESETNPLLPDILPHEERDNQNGFRLQIQNTVVSHFTDRPVIKSENHVIFARRQ